MSSQETREEESTDDNQTCDNCGETYTVETIAGPGKARRSCGCSFTPGIADNTDNAVANVAIRALNAAGDGETAARIHEGTRARSIDHSHEPDYECRHCDWAGDECDRRDHYPVCPDCSRIVDVRQELVEDGGQEPIPQEQYEHIADARDALRKVDQRELPDDVGEFVENAYSKFDWWHDRVEDDPELITDGGVPESFDDLAGTCESCGDDVDPERLIEGECPGCHYYEPVADGGFHTVTRDGQEFAVVRWQEFDEDDEMEFGPDGAIENYDELGTHTTVRLMSADAIREQQMQDRVIGPGDTGWREEYAELELGESIVPGRDGEDPIADGGTAWIELTGFERDLLEAIRRVENDDETTYGLAIKDEVERVYGTDIHHGRLYPNLDDLVQYGLVEKSELDKRTNEYELTPEAEAMLEQRARLLADACGMDQPVADGGDQA